MGRPIPGGPTFHSVRGNIILPLRRHVASPIPELRKGPLYLTPAYFSTTPAHKRVTKETFRLRRWLAGDGMKFISPNLNPETANYNYLTGKNRPFPTNPDFISQPVLSDASREAIWRDAFEHQLNIKTISAQYSVDVRRVAAVLRMKQVEKTMIAEGKPLAKPYARALEKMVPQWHHDADDRTPFEPVNEIHVHSYTMQQVFHPTSESRHFTRADAAQAFGDHILPADERIPLPELVTLERDLLTGKTMHEARQRFDADVAVSEQAIAEAFREKTRRAEAQTKRVSTDRFEFRIVDYNSQKVGRHGRARGAVGWRYGYPYPDRKAGQVNIPTKVG